MLLPDGLELGSVCPVPGSGGFVRLLFEPVSSTTRPYKTNALSYYASSRPQELIRVSPSRRRSKRFKLRPRPVTWMTLGRRDRKQRTGCCSQESTRTAPTAP